MNSFRQENPTPSGLPECITTKEVCNWLGIARSTIHNYILHKNFPKPVKLSTRHHVFLRVEIVDWFQRRQIEDNLADEL
ncbi:MAG: AlpA family transcriptional regulator [Aequorivita sp.]|nr:AlpA family transcriptional regulator [Aequorivita sp.]